MLGRGLKAAAFLIGAGFIAGFGLSAGSAHFLIRSSSPVSKPAGGNEGPPPAAAPSAGKGGKHGGVGEEGSAKEGHGATASQAGGSGHRATAEQALKDGEGQDSVAAAQDSQDPPTATAGQIADFLAGNTLESVDRDGETLVRYLSKMGWQGEPTRSGLVVRRWLARDAQFCLLLSEHGVSCDRITVVRDRNPSDGVGAVLGTVTMTQGVRWTVRRGNPAQLPESIPLIGGEQAAGHPIVAQKPAAVGQKAVAAMTGRTLLQMTETNSPVGYRYEPDGRWIHAQPLVAGAKTGLGGVKVSIGHWNFSQGLFCLDEPGLELKRECFQPEQWDRASFRLRSDRAATVTTLFGVDPT